MVRSTISAAVLLAAVAGLSGCGTSDARYLIKDDNAGIAIVTVPQSDLFQWYYRHEALQYIRDNNPNFKEDRDIMAQGVVYAGERIDRPKVGADGKPIVTQPPVNTDKEYQIVFKRMIPRTPTAVGPLPNNGLPMNTIVPAGGVQNVNPQSSGMNTNTPQFGGVQNVNGMQPNQYQMQQPNSQMMIPPAPSQPTMPNYR
jgi:hypothetical protein